MKLCMYFECLLMKYKNSIGNTRIEVGYCNCEYLLFCVLCIQPDDGYGVRRKKVTAW